MRTNSSTISIRIVVGVPLSRVIGSLSVLDSISYESLWNDLDWAGAIRSLTFIRET
jgi:hypothetical protein